MLKQKIRDFVKSNSLFFGLYRLFGSFAVRAYSLFVPIDEKKAFFISFGGRRYDDSPRCIYEQMLKDDRFRDYAFAWAFVNDGEHGVVPGNPEIVKTDTLAYFRAILSSRLWITNTSVERGLSFKRPGNICVNTWHGSAIKRIGHDNKSGNKHAVPHESEHFEMLCAQSKFDQKVFSGVYGVNVQSVPITGLPRNDSLLSFTDDDIARIKKALEIPEGKKVLLYTPTYREFALGQTGEPVLDIPINVAKWEDELGGDYVLLIRAHYVVTNGVALGESTFVVDVSGYEPLNDLYAIADVMVSDYSSTFIDYSILGKPMLCFAYDFDEYEEKRGFYQEIFDDLPCSIDKTEDELLLHIRNLDFQSASSASAAFGQKYASVRGDASKRVVDEIASRFL